MKKLTTEQFIEKAKSIHGDRYDYSLTKYINTRTKLTIICKEHGVFYAVASKHLSGRLCRACGFVEAKKTNLERYGVENPGQNKEVQEKVKKTNIERYGVEHTFQSDNSKEKIRQTNIKKYGTENPFSSDIIKEKIKKTNLERYGVENPQQNSGVKKKAKQTSNEKYGVGHYSQKNIGDILPLIGDKEWLFEQYITLGKTAIHIAQELGVDDTTIGNYLRQHEIEIRHAIGFSIKSIQWLESIMEQEGIFIQHAMNGGEYRIPGTRYRVDGYCQETNTVYEFHGDIFHGNPDLFEGGEKCHAFNDFTAKELYERTKERENKIRELGYNIITIWENDFNRIIYE
jgi:hypothetical protein